MVDLFDPIQFGAVALKNRIVMAPMTRTRASAGRVPNDLMRCYYTQRASAGLVLTEATAVSPQGVGYPDTPGIWCQAQIDGWRKVTHAVHEKGGRIFVQLWHVGRVSDPEHLNGGMPVAPSALACPGQVSLLRPVRDYVVPRALHTEEIPGIVADFSQAARNAWEAGFDGVEVHAANGYLIDQFLHDGANQRTDAYGGSVENRLRFLLEVVDACIGVWGCDRVGVHLSPGADLHGMRDSDPATLFNHVARALDERAVAFVFARQVPGADVYVHGVRQHYNGRLILNGDFDLQRAREALARGRADAVAFGRAYISNPDLVTRLHRQAVLNDWDASTFQGGRVQRVYRLSHAAARCGCLLLADLIPEAAPQPVGSGFLQGLPLRPGGDPGCGCGIRITASGGISALVQLCLDLGGYLGHVGASRQGRLQDGHDASHGGGAGGALFGGLGDGGCDGGLYVFRRGCLGQEFLQHGDFGVFLRGRFRAAGLFEGGHGFTPLLDLLLDDGGDVGVGQVLALVDFFLFDGRLQESQGAQARGVARAHGRLDGVGKPFLERLAHCECPDGGETASLPASGRSVPAWLLQRGCVICILPPAKSRACKIRPLFCDLDHFNHSVRQVGKYGYAQFF